MGNESSNQLKDQILEAIKNGNLEFVEQCPIKLDASMMTQAITHKQHKIMVYFANNKCPVNINTYICAIDNSDFAALYLLDRIKCEKPNKRNLTQLELRKYESYMDYKRIVAHPFDLATDAEFSIVPK
jgi:hypothetical protein